MSITGVKYSLKQEEAQARERLRLFWKGSSLGRPALYAVAKKPGFEAVPWRGPVLSAREKDLSPSYQAHFAHNAVESLVYLAEAMPGYTVRFDTFIPLLAALAGGTYTYSSDDDWQGFWGETAWIEAWPDVLDHPLPRFDPQSPIVQGLVQVIHAVADTLQDRAIVSPPSWMDPLTTLACFRTYDLLYMDLVEIPEKVKEWTQAATGLLLDAAECFYRACLDRGYGESLPWLPVMVEGRMDPLQCDCSIAFSPEMYAEFVVPDLSRLARYFHRSIYHLDGHENMRFLDQIAALPGINALQYTRIAGSEYPGHCLDDYRAVRAKGLSLYIECKNLEEALEATRLLGPDGLFIVLPPFETVADAEEAIRRIQRAA